MERRSSGTARLRSLVRHIRVSRCSSDNGSMGIRKLLVANRGEIAIRLCRAARELEIPSVAVYAAEDAKALHCATADEAHLITTADGRGGIDAYLNIDAIIGVAQASGADAVIPGYGFLSENAEFVARCEAEGITFVGPSSEVITLFGDKTEARAFAIQCGVPVIPGANKPILDTREMISFVSANGLRFPLMLKAAHGGGGRGMRIVVSAEEMEESFRACTSEAELAFGNGALFVEEYLPTVRHIEFQVLGDGTGAAVHLYERDCSVQRRNQKMIELAPARGINPALRQRMGDASIQLVRECKYRGAGTVEFLLEGDLADANARYYFIEMNPRLQVEHTITEQVTGVDLVQTMLSISGGSSLAQLGLDQASIMLRGHAIQSRVTLMPSTAYLITAYSEPTGPGVRVDACGYAGYEVPTMFDPLLAKVITSSPSPDFSIALRKMVSALSDFQLEGVETNLPSLHRMLTHPSMRENKLFTRFIADNEEVFFGAGLTANSSEQAVVTGLMSLKREGVNSVLASAGGSTGALSLGHRVGDEDPLAVLDMKAAAPPVPDDSIWLAPAFGSGNTSTRADGTVNVASLQQATVVSIAVDVGAEVLEGQALLILNSMKMEQVVNAPVSGVLQSVTVSVAETVGRGQVLMTIMPQDVSAAAATEAVKDLSHIRNDLAETLKLQSYKLDENRPQAVARRAAAGQRTARANIMDLCDKGSFVEYGSLVVAGQRRRRSLQDLRENTPTDGMLCGLGTVNADLFGPEAARAMILAYDYTVLAGTQGGFNHKKKDRMFEIAERLRLPSVFFAEGGGGRPGDTDVAQSNNLTLRTFETWGKLSGVAPMVGITSGYCFAGNAVILGTCDIIIATEGSNIGIGGPAMVEGGGLGVYHAKEIGPLSVHVPNGVVDIVAKDEAHAVAMAKKYLSYFQGRMPTWNCADQRIMRQAIPENRLRVYDVRELINNLADTDSVLELRPFFGLAMVTAFVRIEGRPVGVVANNCMHLSGAVDADAADKATRMMNLCDVFDVPILMLCDCPGFMVGIESESQAAVRHMCRMITLGGSITVPTFCVVTRKAYGLGAQGMGGGSHHAPNFTVSWPTGEFGGMGLEGAVKLGQRKELLSIADLNKRRERYEKLVEQEYQRGRATKYAEMFEVDDVIDPADTRRWITRGLESCPPIVGWQMREKKKRFVDAW